MPSRRRSVRTPSSPGQLGPQRGDLPVGQAVPLGPAQQLRGEGRRVADLVADLADQRDLVDEPRVEAAGRGDLLDGGAGGQRALGDVEPAVDRGAQRLEQLVGGAAVVPRRSRSRPPSSRSTASPCPAPRGSCGPWP
jgi:hypothetical protein